MTSALSASPLDRRLTPARPDLAAEALRGRVTAARFVPGAARRVVAPLAPLRRAPRGDAPLETEALRGEAVTVYDEEEGWAWVQLAGDGYVGYLPAQALGPPGAAPTHRVRALRTFLYPGPDLKLPHEGFLSLGALVTVAGTSGSYARLEDGRFVHAGHLGPLVGPAEDFVAVAEAFLGTPYLWGGKSSLGIDCSGLVQLALAAAGIASPRDSDLQQAELGHSMPIDTESLGRGDLVFWRGHVGLMRDADELLHANGHHMAVASEPLRGARERILRNSFGPVVAVRRL